MTAAPSAATRWPTVLPWRPDSTLAANCWPLFHNGILEEGVSRLRQAGVQATGTLKTWEDPSQAIGAFAQETGADLVVIGHHRRSTLERWWRGSVGHHLLDHLPCSLLVSMHDDAAKRALAGSGDT